jgi:hypothetical protein
MPNFTQKMISVGILAAVFLFLLGNLQQHYSTTFLPITWAPGVRIQPSKDHFEALFQRNAFFAVQHFSRQLSASRKGRLATRSLASFGTFWQFFHHQPMLLPPKIFLSPWTTPGRVDFMFWFQDLKHP